MQSTQQITSKILFLCVTLAIACAAEWNYNDTSPYGPASWYMHYPTCGGRAQSPIDVTQDHVEHILSDPVIFENYEVKPTTQYSLYNAGYGVNLNVPKNLFKVRDGSLPSFFTLEQIHFHWSQINSLGSEHVVNKRVHPLEMHFVHYDSEKYSNVSSAVDDPNGLAVISVNVEIATEGEPESPILGNITSALHAVIDYGNETVIDSFALEGLLPRSREFYRYKGSLTTPGCAESVHWTLFTESIYITHEQMMEFRSIKTSEGEVLEKNFRPVQPINDRIIFHYFDHVSTATTLTLTRIAFFISLTITYLIAS